MQGKGKPDIYVEYNNDINMRCSYMIKNKTLVGYLLMFLSAFCFSLMGIISSLLFKTGIKTYDLMIMQSGVQILMIGTYYSFNKFKQLKISLEDLKIICLQGLLGTVPATYFYYITIQRTNVSIACLLLFTNPIFVTLYYIIFENQQISISKIIVVITAFVGSVLVLNINPYTISDIDIIGILAGIASSISYAFYNIYADKKLKKYSPGAIIFYCTIVVFLFSSIINMNFYSRLDQINFGALKYPIFLTAITNTLPVALLYSGIRIIGAQIASIIATGEIPFTMILSYFVLNEKLDGIQILGSVLIMGAILSLTLLKE